MIKKFGYGDNIRNLSQEDNIELLDKRDYRTAWDINRPIINIYNELESVYDFLNSFADYQLTDTGVFTNSLTHQFDITNSDSRRVTLWDRRDAINETSIQKVYTKIQPGIAGFNHAGVSQTSLIIVNKPTPREMERVVSEVLGLFYHNEEEKVEVKYDQITDTFKCKISKRFDPMSNVVSKYFGCAGCTEISWDDDSINGVSSLILLEDIYNSTEFNTFFVNVFNGDLTKFQLDNTITEVATTGTKYWKILEDKILLSTVNDGFFLGSLNFTSLNPVTITDINKNHIRYGEKVRIDIHGTLDTSFQVNTAGGVDFVITKGIRIKNTAGSEFFIDTSGNLSQTIVGTSVETITGKKTINANNELELNGPLLDVNNVAQTFDATTQVNTIATQTNNITTKNDTIGTKGETITGNETKAIIGTSVETVTGKKTINANNELELNGPSLDVNNVAQTFDATTQVNTIATQTNNIVTKNDTITGNEAKTVGGTSVETVTGRKTSNANEQRINGTVDIVFGAPSITFDTGINGIISFIGKNQIIEGDTVRLGDNIIELNKNQTGVPAAGLFSGMEINRGTEVKAQFLFRESDDTWINGLVGSLKAIANIEDSSVIVVNGIPSWDSTNKILKTDSKFVYNRTNGTLTINVDVPATTVPLITNSTVKVNNLNVDMIDGFHANDSAITADTTLATKNKVKTYVDNADALKANINSPTFTGTVGGITKAMVGLGNVDNTADNTKNVLSAVSAGLATTANQVRGINFHADTVPPSGTSQLNCDGHFYATKVYNAVWNDIADFIQVEDTCEIEFGKAYSFDGKKHSKSKKYADKGVVGIASDTFGFGVGQKEIGKQIPIAIGGFVLAYCDRVYPSGTPLTSYIDGKLTKANIFTRIFNPECIIGTFYKEELSKDWNGIIVNNRNWVKIK